MNIPQGKAVLINAPTIDPKAARAHKTNQTLTLASQIYTNLFQAVILDGTDDVDLDEMADLCIRAAEKFNQRAYAYVRKQESDQ